jgi:hypothetical protein
MNRKYVVFGLAFLLLAATSSAVAQEVQSVRDAQSHILIGEHYDAGTFVGPPPFAAKRDAARSATIEVTYNGFTPQARTAFQYAVEIWERHISSSVPIRIEANYVDLGPAVDGSQVIGSAGPPVVFSFQGSPHPSTWYPPALANAIAGQRVSQTQQIDIRASFNNQVQWYHGTDGNTPIGQFDMVTVVLHEIGHGIGFFGSFRVDDGDDTDRDDCPGVGVNYGCWGYATGQGAVWPVVFDRYVMDAQGRQLINTSVYPNPSLQLGQMLRSGEVEFRGESTDFIAEGAPVSLYSPANFEPASSIAHLDEATYPAGDINSLMTPRIARAEAIHTPGPIFCAMLEDMGWPLGDGCFALLAAELTAFDVERISGPQGIVELTWTTGPDAELDEFIIEQRFFDEPYEEVARVAFVEGQREYDLRLSGLEPGRYTFRIRYVREDGTSAFGPESQVVIPIEGEVVIHGPYPNPASSHARVEILVRRAQSITAELYDMMGRRVDVVVSERRVDANDRLVLDVRRGDLASGVYFLQLRGSRFNETVSVVFVR